MARKNFIFLAYLQEQHVIKLACIYIVDDIIKRRHVDVREVDHGRQSSAADVTRRQQDRKVVGRGAEYQLMSWYP